MKNLLKLSIFAVMLLCSTAIYGQNKKMSNIADSNNFSSNIYGYTFDMVYVQGGTFWQGCTSEQSDCYGDEKPEHRVTVDSYYIGKHEVTQQLWQAVMGNNPSSFQGNNLPVENVSWNDIVGTSGDYMEIKGIKYYSNGFIYKLNKITGKKFRLPTESEWEFAARGGNKSQKYRYSGSNSTDNVGWYYGNSSNKTQTVGRKNANELGIYDMSGNVFEWCADKYSDNYYQNSPSNNPQGADEGYLRVLRGGSWYGSARLCRVSIRNSGTSSDRDDRIGFRLACSL